VGEHGVELVFVFLVERSLAPSSPYIFRLSEADSAIVERPMLRDGNLLYNPAMLTVYRRLTSRCSRSLVHGTGEARLPRVRQTGADIYRVASCDFGAGGKFQ